jgi:uncharacterized membrane protein
VAADIRRGTGSDPVDNRGRGLGHLMYGALWRLMPGPIWLRVILMVLFFAIILAVLILFVFPWLDTFVNVNNNTVGQ